MKRILNRRDIRLLKNESVEEPHEVLLALVDLGLLDAKEVLLACVKEMSDADCKRVLSSLSLASNCDEVEDPEGYMGMDLVPLDGEDEEYDEDNDTEEANESYLKRRQLERRTRRMERLMKNEKGLFGLFSKKKKPADEPKLDLKTFLRIGKNFLENLQVSFEIESDPAGRVETKRDGLLCSWMNGASLSINFDNGKPFWVMSGSGIKSNPSGKLRVIDGELVFVDSDNRHRIQHLLRVQNNFIGDQNDREDRRRAKDRADADEEEQKKRRREIIKTNDYRSNTYPNRLHY